MLNQLKLILDKLFRIWHGQYQPTQLYLWAGFSSPPPKPPSSWFARVTMQARAIACASCQGLIPPFLREPPFQLTTISVQFFHDPPLFPNFKNKTPSPNFRGETVVSYLQLAIFVNKWTLLQLFFKDFEFNLGTPILRSNF